MSGIASRYDDYKVVARLLIGRYNVNGLREAKHIDFCWFGGFGP